VETEQLASTPSPSASPSASASAAASPGAASPSASPTTDAADAQRKQQQDQLKADLAAAKSTADSLAAKANSECPDLKPGEQRHPGAVAYCTRLRSDATLAASQYESLKQQAAAAGVKVQ